MQGVAEKARKWETQEFAVPCAETQQALQRQIQLLESQLHETCRLLRQQQWVESKTHETEAECTDTPRLGNGKSYYGTLHNSSAPTRDPVPSEIRMMITDSTDDNTHDTNHTNYKSVGTHGSAGALSAFLSQRGGMLHHMFGDAVSMAKSMDDCTKEEVNHDSEIYFHSSVGERGTHN